MEDTRYIVFRCYSCEPIYTFSKTIINMINLLDGINNNKGDYYLRHNLSQNATQKKVSSKSLDTFLKKLEDQKVKDFEFICRLKDTDSNTVFPFRFQITYENHRHYSSEAYGRSALSRKILIPSGEFRIEVCIQSYLVPKDLFSKLEIVFKELYISSNSSYGYWDIMDMRNALFSKRSVYERKLLMDRVVAKQYERRVAGIFAGNFLNQVHMEMLKEYFPDIMENCKYDVLDNGSFYLKMEKEQRDTIINSIMFDHILPVDAGYYPRNIKEAFALNLTHIKKLGGIDIIKKCLPDKASLVQYEGGLIILYHREYRNDINELIAFLHHLFPFGMCSSLSISKNFADNLNFIYTKEDKCNICLSINMNEPLSPVPFNLVNSNANPEFCNFERIIYDWITSCGEEPQIFYDEENDILKWEMSLSSFDDIKIIHLYNLLNEYAVENKIFAYFNIGVFKEEGLPIMRKMAIDGFYIIF